MSEEQKSKHELLNELGQLQSRIEKLEYSLEQISKSEKKWRNLVESLPDIVMIVDRQGKLLFVNHTVEGITPEQAIGNSIYNYTLPKHQHVLKDTLERIFQTGKSEIYELEGAGPYGSTSWYESHVGPIKENQHIVAVSIITRDITEHKDIDDALKESEQKYRLLVSNIPDVVWTTDGQGNTVFISDNVQEVYGYSPEEIYAEGSRLWFGMIHHDDIRQVRAAFDALFEKGTPFDVEYRIKRRDGRWIWLHDRSIRTYEKDGIFYADGVFSDISHRKKAEEHLIKTHERLEYILATTPATTYTCKAGDKWPATFMSENVRNLVGYKPQQFVEDPDFWPSHIHPDDRQRVLDGLSGLFENDFYIHEYRFLHKDGNYRWVHDEVRLIRDEHGKPLECIGYWTDITERKQAEKQRNELLSRLNAIIENVPAWIFLKDIEGRYIAANRAFFDLLPASVDDPIGKRDRDLFRKELADIFEAEDNEVLHKGVKIKRERRIRLRNGRVGYMLVSIAPVIDHLNKVAGLVAIAVDITEREKAEEQLRISEQKFKDLTETTTDWIWEVDKEGVYTYVSPNVKELLGYEVSEVLGKTPFDLMPEEESKRIGKIFREKAFNRKPFYKLENVNRHKDGHLVILETNGIPIFDEKGQFKGYRGIDRDITDRKKAEEKIRESEEKFRQLVSTTTDAIMLFDAKTRQFIEINKACEQLYGYTREEFLQLSHLDITAESKKSDESIKKTLEGKLDSIPLRYHKKKDGTVFPVEISASVFELAGRQVLCGVVRDITDRKRAEDALRQSENKYKDLVEEMPDVIYTLDKAGRVTSVNRAGKATFGREPEEVIGKSFTEWIPKVNIPDAMAAFKRILGGEKITTETVLLDKDGKPHNVEFSSTPTIKNGTVVGTRGIIRDITERKQAEKKIWESEEKYRQFVSTTKDAIMLYDAETRRFIEVNKACEQLYGYTRGEFLQLTHPEITAEPEKSDASIKKALEGKLDSIPLRYHKKKDGTLFPVEISASVFELAGRQVLCRVVRDITERQKREQFLRESEERFRAIFENAADGIVLADIENMKFHTANETFCQMIGYDPSEIETLSVADIHPKQDLPFVAEQFEKQVRKEITLARDIHVKRKDGTVFYADINSFPIEVASRKYLMGIFRDVTERKRAEQALAESEQRYRTLVESAGEAIATLDKNGVFLFVNITGANRLGGKPQDYIGKKLSDVFPKNLAERQTSDIRRVIQTSIPMNTTALIELQGQLRWHNTTIEPLRDNTGKVSAAMVIARDIHEFKQAQEELHMYHEQMVRAEQLASVGTLSATLAHEMTQPLTVIRLSIENSLVELKKSCPKTVTEGLNDSLAEISHITSIIDRFRHFARKSSDKTIRKVQLNVLAKRIATLLEESARRAKIDIILEDLDKLPILYACEKDLEQVFFALVENTIQAADGKKSRQLTISGDIKDQYVELRFSDNCRGIKRENIDKIFEPFFTTRPDGQGTGLGLCIVQRIVTEVGGKVWVESKIGKGSTFFVNLPVKGRL